MKGSVNILVVEDDLQKAESILQVLTDIPTVTRDSITHVTCVIAAKKALAAESFDLLVLDIQLPRRDGQRPEPDAGVKLWQTVTRSGYKRPAHVIGLTAYEETRRNLGSTLEDENWLLVQYSDSSTGWRDQISQKVEHILALKTQVAIDESSFLTSALVVTAVDIEAEAIRRLPYNWSPDVSLTGGALLHKGEFPQNGGGTGKVVTVTAHQMGMPASACLTLSAILELRPRYVLMSGITAGVRTKVNLGDILVADPSWDWGSGKLALQKGNRIFQPDPRPLRVPYDLIALCQKVGADQAFLNRVRDSWSADKPDTVLKLRIGPVASGATVVADDTVVAEIKEHARKVIGIEMETYGVYYAGYVAPNPRPKVVSIKSVCDFADAEKDDRFQSYAAYTSACVVQELIERQLPFGA